MPITIDDSALIAGLNRLINAQQQAITAGLRAGAANAQAQLQATQAHGDITTATRTSYRVYADVDNETASASGFAAASAAIAAAEAAGTSHGGKALRQTVHTLGPDQRGACYTAYTDYIDDLQRDNGGQKAALGPTLQATASTITAAIARESRNMR